MQGGNKMEKRFGEFGGQYVPETLMNPLKDLEKAYEEAINDSEFIKEYRYYCNQYSGRPTPLYYAEALTKKLGGAKIYLKREDLNHTGAHKINNVLGQMLLAKRMGKKKIIAETGAGQHGLATATVAAMLGLESTIFMGEEDIKRQAVNVKKIELLGARVVPVALGTRTLKDATNQAIRHWVSDPEESFYIIGSVVGPAPYPSMVRDFQKIIGEEAREQILESEGKLPDYLIACVGGGSNALGLFYPFIEDEKVKMYGIEAGGKGVETGEHAASLSQKKKGVIHGMLTYLLSDDYGQIQPAYSISAGLDYPGVGPEHAYLHDKGRVNYSSARDDEAVEAFKLLCQVEGIIPALESSHALAYLLKMIDKTKKDEIVIVNLSGRGDKDLDNLFTYMEGVKND